MAESPNGRLSLEDGLDRCETLAKCISDDWQFFIFRCWIIFWKKRVEKISRVDFCFQKGGVLEKLWSFERHWQIHRKKLLPVVVDFLGNCLGEGVNDSIWVKTFDLAPKMTSTIWCCDLMVIWYNDNMMATHHKGFPPTSVGSNGRFLPTSLLPKVSAYRH